MNGRLHTLPPPDDKRPLIRVIAGQLPDVADRAERILIDQAMGYRRGISLVRVVSFESSSASRDGIRRAPDASVIVPFDRPALVDGITRAAKIEKFDGRSESWKPIDCPAALADTLVARLGANFPLLTTVVSCPTMRAEASDPPISLRLGDRFIWNDSFDSDSHHPSFPSYRAYVRDLSADAREWKIFGGRLCCNSRDGHDNPGCRRNRLR
jgi:hypothetical protein